MKPLRRTGPLSDSIPAAAAPGRALPKTLTFPCGKVVWLGSVGFIRERLHERIIVMSHARLEERVLGLLKRALSEGRLDVADHLLKALEALCHDERPSASVAAAYLAIGKRPPRRSLAGTARM